MLIAINPRRDLSPICGDGIIEHPEECDDNNIYDNDGCNSTCFLEPGYELNGNSVRDKCGDGLVMTRVNFTNCDDGNQVDGDGCSSNCVTEKGYICYKGGSSQKDSCYAICGDGITLEVEQDENFCDDGNSLEGDGCSRDCKVEEGYSCEGGGLDSPDICKKDCKVENCVKCDYEDENKCIVCREDAIMKNNQTCYKSPVSEKAKKMNQATMAASGSASSVALGISLLSLSSPMAVWVLANQFQLFSLFLLTNTGLPQDIIEYIKGNDLFSFSMDFIPFSSSTKTNGVMKNLDKAQKDQSLKNIGLKSQSALINITGLFITMFLLGLLHLISYCLQSNSEANIDPESTRGKINKVVVKIYEAFTLGVYIRFLLEAFQFILLSSASEIKFFDLSNSNMIASLTFAFVLFCLTVVFTVFSFRQVFSPLKTGELERSKLEEFNTGLKDTNFSRVYTPLILLRRYFFIVWLICWLNSDPICIVSGMICFQGMYLFILCLLRPADDPVNNLIEIINECIFSALLIILLPINSASEWTNLIESIFIWIMVGNTLIITVILVTSFIFKLKKKCNNLPEKNKIVDISGKVVSESVKFGQF
ncbi:unnamed protein product [Moneuplotes crassus]|uniref:DUF4215 domain-containing protein n=1 Tax=Euplotes crassus TaxID=5936 RepID=A0AAD1XKW2_EUPCR|nr:unnamed protein product [Moneuplotes crassus]